LADSRPGSKANTARRLS
jgi:hypothetical protein